MSPRSFFRFFFFNDTATTEIYTLSLHDALPICADPALPLEAGVGRRAGDRGALRGAGVRRDAGAARAPRDPGAAPPRRGGGRVRAGHDDGAARCGGQAPGLGAHHAPAQRAMPRRDARSRDDGALGAEPRGRVATAPPSVLRISLSASPPACPRSCIPPAPETGSPRGPARGATDRSAGGTRARP